MTLKQVCKEVYAAFVKKAQADIAAGEKATLAVDVGNDIVGIGQSWTGSIGNDGKISDDEATKMNETFAAVVDKRIPDISGAAVTFIYEGFTLFGFGFKGLKSYLNKWFNLGL